MQLHRIITAAGFVADPNWSGSQVPPPSSVIATALGGLPIGSQTEGGRIYWTITPYNGDTADSKPADGTGTTFDARLVYTINANHVGSSSTPIVIGRKSPGEVEGSPIPIGREIVELEPPQGMVGTIQMIALTPAGPATHFWIFWSSEKREGR